MTSTYLAVAIVEEAYSSTIAPHQKALIFVVKGDARNSTQL